MSFSSLPTELVRQIIESSVPSTFHSSTYGERQSTLCSLSLVSHRLQQIAQPLLREVVCFTTTRRVVANMELLNTGVFYDSVRHLSVMDWDSMDAEPELIRRIIANARNLCTLVLTRARDGAFDLSILSNLSNLSTLQLTGGIFTFPQHAPLSNLDCLIASDEVLPVVLPLLNPTFLPNLAHLSLRKVYGDRDHKLLEGSGFSALLPQLRSLNVHWKLVIQRPDYLKECFDRTLVDCTLFDCSQFADISIDVRHLRILYLLRARQSLDPSLMNRLIRWIDVQSQNRLHSLYFDSSLNPIEDVSPGTSTAMEKLIQTCEVKKVEVVFERQVEEWGVDLAQSGEFRRRRRERRRLEGDQANQKSVGADQGREIGEGTA